MSRHLVFVLRNVFYFCEKIHFENASGHHLVLPTTARTTNRLTDSCVVVVCSAVTEGDPSLLLECLRAFECALSVGACL